VQHKYSISVASVIRASGLGASDTGLGITRVKTDTVMVVPVAPVTCTTSVLLAARMATRSTLVAPAAKSESPKTWVPFSVAESALRLLGAESVRWNIASVADT